VIIANQTLQKKADPPAAAEPPVADPDTPTKNILTTQWLSVISIIISVVGIYYKRKEIKKSFCQKTASGPHSITCRFHAST